MKVYRILIWSLLCLFVDHGHTCQPSTYRCQLDKDLHATDYSEDVEQEEAVLGVLEDTVIISNRSTTYGDSKSPPSGSPSESLESLLEPESQLLCQCERPHLDYLIHNVKSILQEYMEVKELETSEKTNLMTASELIFGNCMEVSHSIRLDPSQIQQLRILSAMTSSDSLFWPQFLSFLMPSSASQQEGEDKEAADPPLRLNLSNSSLFSSVGSKESNCITIIFSEYRDLTLYLEGNIQDCVDVEIRHITEELKITGSIRRYDPKKNATLKITLQSVARASFSNFYIKDKSIRFEIRTMNVNELHSDGRMETKVNVEEGEADLCYIKEEQVNCTMYFSTLEMVDLGYQVVYLMGVIILSSTTGLIYLLLRKQDFTPLQEKLCSWCISMKSDSDSDSIIGEEEDKHLRERTMTHGYLKSL